MTWLSRLLPQSRSLQRRADHHHDRRGRQGRRHRRTVNLEWLEQRTLLAGDVTVGPVVNGVLTIAADTFSDHFDINEVGGSQVVVSGTPNPGTQTSINGLPPGTSVTRAEVISIVVIVPGDGQNAPVISLEQTGLTSGIGGITFLVGSQAAPPQPAGPDLTLTVTGAVNAGALTVLDIPGGTLNATVSGSVFSSIDIEQQNCCPANVGLTNDIAGPVNVSLGWAQGDSISFHNDNFGSTSFTLGNGPNPQMANCDNAGSTISGDDSNFRNLTIHEPLAGANQTISVGTATSDVEVSLTSFGIVATQGDGNNNSITLVSITTSGQPTNNPNFANDNIVTVQGNGNDDHVVVDSSRVFGNIESTQGDGARDQAYFFGDNAGFTLRFGPIVEDFNGLEQILQGDGDNDFAWLDCGRVENVGAANVANNVFISQGLGIFTPGCTQQFSDRIDVQWTQVTSDMTLEQGEIVAGDPDDPTLELGSNIIQIATPTNVNFPVANAFAASFLPPSAGGINPGTEVEVGNSTVINELGPNNGNNAIIMGGIGGLVPILQGGAGNPNSGAGDFETGFLDVFTGAAGGAFVSVQNTQVFYGALGTFGPFNFNSGGTGNIALIDTNSFLGFVDADGAGEGQSVGITFDAGFSVLI
jgi:hypothetical protein